MTVAVVTFIGIKVCWSHNAYEYNVVIYFVRINHKYALTTQFEDFSAVTVSVLSSYVALFHSSC